MENALTVVRRKALTYRQCTDFYMCVSKVKYRITFSASWCVLSAGRMLWMTFLTAKCLVQNCTGGRRPHTAASRAAGARRRRRRVD